MMSDEFGVKLPAHRGGFPARYIICIVPLDPAYKAGLAGHVPVKSSEIKSEILRTTNSWLRTTEGKVWEQ